MARHLRVCAALLTLTCILLGCTRTEAPAPEPVAQPQIVSEPRSAPHVESQTAILAGGCFWGVEELLRTQPGVLDTAVGYTGGTVSSPDYSDVKTGTSGHAEAVRVTFDPSKTSYERLLLYFFSIHDPTTENRQGNDVGTQYRSAIFVLDDAQRSTAERVIEKVNAAGDWKAPITTQVVTATEFHLAEDYHQDYLQKNPGGYTCHYPRDVSFY